jgi:hypothetical protein
VIVGESSGVELIVVHDTQLTIGGIWIGVKSLRKSLIIVKTLSKGKGESASQGPSDIGLPFFKFTPAVAGYDVGIVATIVVREIHLIAIITIHIA